MFQRFQNTIARTVSVSGFGLFHGADVRLEFCPAPTDHGIVFERVDLKSPVQIPALIEYVTPQERCTVITHQGANVAVIEHVMAALAGLQVDNCLVRLNAPEPPIGDGSSSEFVNALQRAGIVQQDVQRQVLHVDELTVEIETDRVGIAAQPCRSGGYQIGFILDYGRGPIPHQSLNLTITPESFVSELANCRTFVLEQEADALRAKGLALRATPQNALVFGKDGILGNSLRRPDECVRHKILDCVGDFALIGCDLVGRFTASRSGHRLNQEMIRHIRARQSALHSTLSPAADEPASVISLPFSPNVTNTTAPEPRLRRAAQS